MSIVRSNYNNGFAGGVTIQNVPIDLTVSNKVYWVATGNGASDGNPGTFDRPFSSIDYAIGRCAANRGDVIFVKAGYAETITSAGAITSDVVGVSIIGLGTGSDRPQVTWTSTDNSATWLVTAANTTIKNIVGICGDDGLTSAFVVSAAGCVLDVEWQDASATVEAATAILTTADADNLDIKLKYVGYTAGNACVSPILLVGGSQTRVDIDFYGLASTAVVEFKTTAVVDCNVTGYMYNSGTTDFSKSVVDTVTGSTWAADFFDGAAGGRASGGSGGALATDDATIINSKVDSVGTLTSTGNSTGTLTGSKATSIGTALATVASKQTSTATLWSTQYSTLVSKIDSNT